MRNSNRLISLIMMAALMLVAVVPTGFAEIVIDEPVTIKVVWCQASTMSGMEYEIDDAMAEAYPNVTIDWEIITWEDLPSKMQQYMQSGLPDAVFAKSQDANNFGEYNVWADLSQTEYIKSVYDSTFYGVTRDGKILGMPYLGSYGGVYYNRQIFSDLGLEYPKNVEELENICAVLKENGITPFATHYLDTWYVGWVMAIAAGNELMSVSETWGNEFRDGERDASDEDFVRAINLMKLIYDNTWEDCYSVEQSTCDARFVKGEAAMQFDMAGVAATYVSLNPELDFGLFPFPSTLGNGCLNMEPDQTFFKSATTEHGDAVDALFTLLAQPEMASKFSQIDGQASLIHGAESFQTPAQSDIDYFTGIGLSRDQNKITNQIPFNEFWADLASDYTEYLNGNITMETIIERANSRRAVCGHDY